MFELLCDNIAPSHMLLLIANIGRCCILFGRSRGRVRKVWSHVLMEIGVSEGANNGSALRLSVVVFGH